jgi:hypothetical protein
MKGKQVHNMQEQLITRRPTPGGNMPPHQSSMKTQTKCTLKQWPGQNPE